MDCKTWLVRYALDNIADHEELSETIRGIIHETSYHNLSSAYMRLNPDDPDHGTETGYGRGCRCDACRKAHTEYSRDHRALLKQRRKEREEAQRRALVELEGPWELV